MVQVFLGRMVDSASQTVIENAAVAVEGERIMYAGPKDGYTIPEGAAVYEIPNGTILPGFIDAHAHLVGMESIHRSGDSDFDLLSTLR